MTANEEKLYTSIGHRIRIARKRCGYTQGQLASLVDQTRTSIVNIEAGRQAMPLARLIELAEWLNTDPRDLVFGEDYIKD